MTPVFAILTTHWPGKLHDSFLAEATRRVLSEAKPQQPSLVLEENPSEAHSSYQRRLFSHADRVVKQSKAYAAQEFSKEQRRLAVAAITSMEDSTPATPDHAAPDHRRKLNSCSNTCYWNYDGECDEYPPPTHPPTPRHARAASCCFGTTDKQAMLHSPPTETNPVSCVDHSPRSRGELFQADSLSLLSRRMAVAGPAVNILHALLALVCTLPR